MPILFAGVLLGGRSRRMGQPKQLLTWDGVTFVERVVAALRATADHIVLLGDGPVPDALAGLLRLADLPHVQGPLAGMLAAMVHAPQVAWLFAGCDQPLLSPAAVAWLVDERRPEYWAILPRRSARGVEPLLALYEPPASALLGELAGSGAPLQRLAGNPRVHTPTPPAALRAAWRNVNTPEDLRRLRRHSSR